MKRRSLVVILGLFMALAASAASAGTFALEGWSRHLDGVDQVFEIDVKNVTPNEARLQGRLVAISVYDTSRPTVMLIPDRVVASGATSRVELRWSDAPVIGYVRALLVLTDGANGTTVEPIDFWILPVTQAAWFAGIALLALVLVIGAMRLPVTVRGWGARVPSGMTAYAVEFDDTVVSVSNRYGVTWQDIVKANRLKPPYALRPGTRIFIPKHSLRKPGEAAGEEKPKKNA